jgi:hypothetical protein
MKAPQKKMLNAGCWMLDAGCWMLEIDYLYPHANKKNKYFLYS